MLKIRCLTTVVVGAVAMNVSGAFAQESGFCGQPAVLTSGNYSISGKGALPVDAIVSIARGEPAYLEFTIESATGITIETFSNDLDPLVILLDSNGQMVRSDDDGSGTLNS
ncbi:MAG: hypothetical protein ACC631_04770, partial [Halocynthiibacter sp.]